jgi:bifunctional NMN adenylyltransferase/nudix hydrolase
MIGRFQPIHEGHMTVLKQAFEAAQHVIILVGSSNRAPSLKNPLDFQDRSVFITMALKEEYGEARFTIKPIDDFTYDDQKWVTQVQVQVGELIGKSYRSINTVALVGYEKDDTSYYLKMFPQWDYVEVDQEGIMSATDIRECLYSMDVPDFVENCKKVMCPAVLNTLATLKWAGRFRGLTDEYNFIKKYKASWKFAPYAPTFVTSDMVVIESGHILLIERGAYPGKGLWALPGGYINQNETVEDCAIRELKEETKIKVPVPALRGCIKRKAVFDKPNRDPRGRYITHAFLIELPTQEKGLTKVKGGDDAARAKWFPLSELEDLKEKMFLDHWDIVQNLL